jgi:hypothetical protein
MTLFNILSLLISAATLGFLIKYVSATNTIAAQSIRQVEATFRPALVCIPGGSMNDGPKLANIGKGPAIEIEWSYATTTELLQDRIPYLEPNRPEPSPLRYFPSVKPLFEPVTKPLRIILNYKSISGARYSSTCIYDIERDEFSTEFSEEAS